MLIIRNSFYKANTTLILKLEKDIPKKKTIQVFLVNIDKIS